MTTPRKPSPQRRSSSRRKKPAAARGGLTLSAKGYMIGLLLVAVAVAIMALRDRHQAEAAARAEQPDYYHLDMVETNPDLQEQLIRYTGMNVSFNGRYHIPNWVAWELTADESEGDEPRSGKFVNDPKVYGCAYTSDYTRSGYDRGHMAPAGDMKWSPLAMKESFYMSNICPQLNALNTGAWKTLEEKCRQRAKADSVVYIVCGPVLTDKLTETIGETAVAVPKRFFKVVLSPYTSPPLAIGFIMENGRVKGGMQSAAVSIDEVERVTGHDFFAELPDSLETQLERQCNFHHWSTAGL